jgi:hypothetical protein
VAILKIQLTNLLMIEKHFNHHRIKFSHHTLWQPKFLITPFYGHRKGVCHMFLESLRQWLSKKYDKLPFLTTKKTLVAIGQCKPMDVFSRHSTHLHHWMLTEIFSR